MAGRRSGRPDFVNSEKVDEMPFIQAQNYTLLFGTTANPTGPPVISQYLRMLPLPFVGSGNAIDHVTFIYSSDLANSSVGERSGRTVVGYFPFDEFAGHRDIIQSESPIFVEWTEDPAISPRLRSVVLRTDEEPTGEGPADVSF
jgi:hypothetical protein